MPDPSPITSVAELFAVLGDDERDAEAAAHESVTSSAHALQCAALLARRFPDDVGLQVAGLVHDIGHRACPDAPEDHGRLGGAMVASLLGPRVARLVELHVPAKRYLVAVDETYVEGLSPMSDRTLELQGGPLTDVEAEAFQVDPDAAAAISLRRADDEAKVLGRDVAPLASWRPVVDAWARAV